MTSESLERAIRCQVTVPAACAEVWRAWTTTEGIRTQGGWGESGQWDEAFAYFQHAWGAVVLPRLRLRFAVGPVDWTSPPALDPA